MSESGHQDRMERSSTSGCGALEHEAKAFMFEDLCALCVAMFTWNPQNGG